MLVELNIKNFAIIENLNVEFSKGLNIITGETGTGKSILIEALGVILGSRSNKDYIRTGKDSALLEAVFYVEDSTLLEGVLNRYGIPLEEDGILIINKKISQNSPSLSKVNGKTVNLTMLNEVTRKLVDIFGQHEHQSLLDISNHKKIIDSFGDLEFVNLKEEIGQKFDELQNLNEKLNRLNIDDSARDREIDILDFQINEIENAGIDLEKDSTIQLDYIKYKSLNDIRIVFASFLSDLDSEDFSQMSILSILNKHSANLNNIKKLDEEIEDIYERVENIKYEIEDINRESIAYIEGIDIDDYELIELEKRLDLINTLKNKYGNSLEEVLKFKETAREKLSQLLNQDKEIEKIDLEIEKVENDLYSLSEELSEKRKIIAGSLEKDIQKQLEELNMENIEFKVFFEDEKHFKRDGFDNLEFLISTNVGEELKPLSKIASGGEMSRIMLAFKSILAEYDNIQTMIFDEIDTGISGRTAQIVGEKIYDISRNHQVICISHLPQITALADNHYSINKETIGEKTGSYIKKLNFNERVEEMARLIGGVDVTDTTLKHAYEMIKMTNQIK